MRCWCIAALAAGGAARNATGATEASAACAANVAGDGAAAWARGLSEGELRALARLGNATCTAGVAPLVDAAGAAALAAGAAELGAAAAARWARLVGGGAAPRPAGGGAPAGGARPPTTAAPPLEWAQGADAVYIRVKWATADAAPPALDVADVRVACAPWSVALDAASAARNARFALAFAPYAPVARCRFEAGAVGRGVLTLEKGRRARWPRLERDAARPRPNTWWDRQEQFRDELAGLSEALPDDGRADSGAAGAEAPGAADAAEAPDAAAAAAAEAETAVAPPGAMSLGARLADFLARRGSGAAGAVGAWRAAAARLADRLRPGQGLE